jgi:hypothetical protein
MSGALKGMGFFLSESGWPIPSSNLNELVRADSLDVLDVNTEVGQGTFSLHHNSVTALGFL